MRLCLCAGSLPLRPSTESCLEQVLSVISAYYRSSAERGNRDWHGELMVTMHCIKRAHTPIWLVSDLRMTILNNAQHSQALQEQLSGTMLF